jgi:hypothetical protein
MHRIFNYGSFLQGYALKEMLRSLNTEAIVGFLDYHPGAPLSKSDERSARGITRIAQKLSEYSKVDASMLDKFRFFNHKRTYASRHFPILGLTSEPNYDYQVDLQVIGSDEVFNCVQGNTNVGYSRDLFGHRSPAKRLISYAGSFGNTTIEKLKKYSLVDELGQDFSRFADISVRDGNSCDIVRELVGKNPSIHVDPVLAYDYMKECKRIPSHRILKERYLIVYGYSGRFTREESDVIRAYARSKGLKVICIGGVQGCCDRFVDCSPFEVLALFRDAEGIVTDTFHGTIFSIINEKRFLTIIRRSHGEGYGNEEKLHYLLKSLALEGRDTFSLTLENVHDVLSNTVDYALTNELLDAARVSARSYLGRNVAVKEAVA